uniref:Diguanylate cyclase domain-containing protein n=1 Tax=Desertifilum tharense IPPAS B-1220 TaxID=1781255 RepID=A0ACD5H2M6_9CYAN
MSEPWLGDGSPEPQPGNQDELTQLANRRYFHHYLKQAWQQVRTAQSTSIADFGRY